MGLPSRRGLPCQAGPFLHAEVCLDPGRWRSGRMGRELATSSADLVHEVRRRHPRIKVVFTSGRPLGECPLPGVKRTSATHTPMSAFDPKRTLSRLNQISPASTNDCLVTSICSGLRCSSASRNAVKGMRDSSLENGTASWDRPNRQVLCARMPPSLGWPSRSGMMGCSLGLLSGVVLGCSQDM